MGTRPVHPLCARLSRAMRRAPRRTRSPNGLGRGCAMRLLPFFFFLMIRPPPRSTLFPYTTLFHSFGSAGSADCSMGGLRHHGEGDHPVPVRVLPHGDQHLSRRQKRRSEALGGRSRFPLFRRTAVVEYRASGVAAVHRDGIAAGAWARIDRHGARRPLHRDLRHRLPDRARREHLSGGQDVRADRDARHFGRDAHGAAAIGREIRGALDCGIARGLNPRGRRRRRREDIMANRYRSIRLLALAVLGIALADAMSRAASAQSCSTMRKINIGVSVAPPNVVHTSPYVAKELGFFTKRCIEPTIIQFEGGASATSSAAAAQGSAIVSVNDVAIGRGMKVQQFWGLAPRLPQAYVVSPDVKTAADLKGRRLSATGGGVGGFHWRMGPAGLQ